MSQKVGGKISVLAKKNAKMAILQDKWKNFEKTKRDEAMKWYLSHTPGQEEHFKLYFTPSLDFLNFLFPY